jgi:hypothetical protein
VETEKAYIVKNTDKTVIVGHVYRLDDDSRRHTDFYACGTIKSAENLVLFLSNK